MARFWALSSYEGRPADEARQRGCCVNMLDGIRCLPETEHAIIRGSC